MSKHDPLYAELFEKAISSDELVRIESNMRRHKERGAYNRSLALHSVARYVVEPAAIALAGEKGERWFNRYGKEVRQRVAEGILRCEEREVA